MLQAILENYGNHICISVAVGILLDLIFGDPYRMPHPVRWIGHFIDVLSEKLLQKEDTPEKKRRKGKLLVMLVLGSTVLATILILYLAYAMGQWPGLLVQTVMCYQILAMKSLKTESMRVYKKLEKGELEEARKAVSMIVGRDTDALDEQGIIRATVETVAENTSDGVIAPLLYLLLGGPVLGFAYKAINTMDSMIGYKNERYIDFGRTAAKLDDVVNFLPSRISACMMIAASFLCNRKLLRACSLLSGNRKPRQPGYDYAEKAELFPMRACSLFSGRNAYRIYKKDRKKHASPNSAQTESVCAGALQIQLAGNAYYSGKLVEKPYIGDKLREIECQDIIRANRLLYATTFSCALAGILLRYWIMSL